MVLFKIKTPQGREPKWRTLFPMMFFVSRALLDIKDLSCFLEASTFLKVAVIGPPMVSGSCDRRTSFGKI